MPKIMQIFQSVMKNIKKSSVLLMILYFLDGFSQEKFVKEYPQEHGIEFEIGDWQSIMDKAKEEDKLIFVNSTASWCSPCIKMKKYIFTDPKVGEFFNANFIPYQVDIEKGEGPKLKEKYNLRGLPGFHFIDGYGNVLHQDGGYMDSKSFILVGKQALDPLKRTSALLEKYKKEFNNGNRNPEFIKTYLELLKEIKLNNENVLNTYFASLDKETWISEENLVIMKKYLRTPKNEYFQFVRKNKEEFAKFFLNGKVGVDQFIKYNYTNYLRSVSEKGTDEQFIDAIQTVNNELEESVASALIQDALAWRKETKND